MNVRKNIDYSAMFAALDAAIRTGTSQMARNYKLGCIVCTRSEKGAAVAAAEYLSCHYPDVPGLSPRNLRRMRDFCRLYEREPELLALAMEIGWTQNVVILEADLSMKERRWYLRAVMQFGWTKAELQRKIASAVHLEIQLEESSFQSTVCESHILHQYSIICHQHRLAIKLRLRVTDPIGCALAQQLERHLPFQRGSPYAKFENINVPKTTNL